MENSERQKPKYFEQTIRKSVSLEKDIEGMMPGSRARGRAKMNWISNVTSWTGLTTEGAIRAEDDEEVWKKTVYDATNPCIEDG